MVLFVRTKGGVFFSFLTSLYLFGLKLRQVEGDLMRARLLQQVDVVYFVAVVELSDHSAD